MLPSLWYKLVLNFLYYKIIIVSAYMHVYVYIIIVNKDTYYTDIQVLQHAITQCLLC